MNGMKVCHPIVLIFRRTNKVKMVIKYKFNFGLLCLIRGHKLINNPEVNGFTFTFERCIRCNQLISISKEIN